MDTKCKNDASVMQVQKVYSPFVRLANQVADSQRILVLLDSVSDVVVESIEISQSHVDLQCSKYTVCTIKCELLQN